MYTIWRFVELVQKIGILGFQPIYQMYRLVGAGVGILIMAKVMSLGSIPRELLKYEARLFFMKTASILIFVHAFFYNWLDKFILGPTDSVHPLLIIALAPILGLVVGIVDVSLTRIIIARVDPARLEMDAELFRELQEPYMAPPRTSVPRILIYTLGEEAIRGMIMMYTFYLGTRGDVLQTWILGIILYLFARRLPLYARIPKIIDDAVFSALFLFGGLPAAWLAHAVANIYITWPLQRHGGAARQA